MSNLVDLMESMPQPPLLGQILTQNEASQVQAETQKQQTPEMPADTTQPHAGAPAQHKSDCMLPAQVQTPEAAAQIDALVVPKTHDQVGAPPSEASAPSNHAVPQEVLAKSLLNEYAQKAALPLPLYETLNEGPPHAPRFRSTVIINNVKYSSPNVFPQRKAAEKDVANIALQSLAPQVMEANCSLDFEDLMFCKSMLNEYATKINAEKPIYSTKQEDGLRPVFVSSLMFDGKHYVGDKARNKKDSEQLAARAVILAIIDSDERMCKIVNSKKMLCAAKDKVKNPCNTQNVAMPVGLQTDSNIEANTAPTISVPPTSEQGINSTSQKKRKRKKTKQAEDTVGTDAQSEQVVAVPSSSETTT